MRNLAVLGSTGSVGTQTLSIVEKYKDRFKVKALAADKNVNLLTQQVKKFNPNIVCVGNTQACLKFKNKVKNIKVVCGEEGLIKIAEAEDVDTILFAISGISGMEALKKGLEKGKRIAISTKELIVCFGEVLRDFKKRFKGEIVPVDSEHSAVFQCIHQRKKEEVKRIILTASGGPLLYKNTKDVKKEEVLKHPVWKMGIKTTIDSATMMNKCLEIIEAHYLFDIEPEKIDVLIHPQGLVHSMVEFIDGSIVAQLAVPDMRIPILYALSYPDRLSTEIHINFEKVPNLQFMLPDRKKFPALNLAYEVLSRKMTYPAVLAAADEEAVEMFIRDEISFEEIVNSVKECINAHTPLYPNEENIKKAVYWAKQYIREKRWCRY